MANLTSRQAWDEIPLVLTIPGHDTTGTAHWLSRWEQRRHDFQRVEPGQWNEPHRNTWANRINLAIHRANRPIVLLAHGLGCLAVTWWARYERPVRPGPVVAAMLVAPPDVDRAGVDRRLARFAPVPDCELPFSTCLVASRNDPALAFARAAELGRAWGARLFDGGLSGDLGPATGMAEWEPGEALLNEILLHHYAANRRTEARPAQSVQCARDPVMDHRRRAWTIKPRNIAGALRHP